MVTNLTYLLSDAISFYDNTDFNMNLLISVLLSANLHS